jgi:hypothetical protein
MNNPEVQGGGDAHKSPHLPGKHACAVLFVEPAGQANPALQSPVQEDVVKPPVNAAPYRPGAHSEHCAAPLALHCPLGHTTCVALIEPLGQAYPAAHAAVHRLEVSPATPYRPAAHMPVQLGVVKPLVSPYSPAGHDTHALSPREYLPTVQGVQGAEPPLLLVPAAQTMHDPEAAVVE